SSHAGDLFIDPVGDLVRDAAQLGFAAGERHTVQLAFLDRVGQAVAHLVAAIRATGDAAISQEVGALGAPVVVSHRRIYVKARAGRADQAELAGTGEIGADDFCDGAAVHFVYGEVGDGHGVLCGAGTGNIDAQLRMG